ncbi:MAG: hypothetical protein ACRDYW_07275 [Acidimicrobiales bacterium]
MSEPLDVLVIESHPGAAAPAVAALEAAGHRTMGCYADGDRGFPCVGITEPELCPIDRGADVALLIRRRIAPRPTPLEGGVPCAIRAQIPIVESGPDILDPFEPWLAQRTTGDAVVAACEQAHREVFDPLRDDIATRLGPVSEAGGFDPHDLECDVNTDGDGLRVGVSGPELSRARKQAIGVRVLDAVRDTGRRYGKVDVRYETADPAE